MFSRPDLPDSIYNKVESFDLKRSLKRVPPYIELTTSEYEMIKDKLVMPTIQIEVKKYYGNPSYYSVMPRVIFDALEIAALNGEEFTAVDKPAFDKMITDYKDKMK